MQNSTFAQSLESRALRFVDVMNLIQSPVVGGDSPTFKPVLDVVSLALEGAKGTGSPLIILDDISSLEWMGFSTIDLSKFIRALVATCRKVWILDIQRSLVILTNTVKSVSGYS